MKNLLIVALTLLALPAAATQDQRSVGRAAIQSLTGCYLVDYSYTETESLQPGYTRDGRVYDVNKNMSVKEWIYSDESAAGVIRLQHVLFATDLSGNFIDGSILKHTGEDWEYSAKFLYDFTMPLNWEVKDLSAMQDVWTRKVLNLDDGLRYQCAAAWSMNNAYPEWSCDGYSPIPGREFRDMGRKDYNTLDRSTRILAYGNSWLERQANTKVIHQNGVRTPLAKELGKNWYVRLPDSECAVAQNFVTPRQDFWAIVREAWEQVLIGDRPFIEKAIPGQSRYMKVMALEAQYLNQNVRDPATRKAALNAVLTIIQDFRAN